METYIILAYYGNNSRHFAVSDTLERAKNVGKSHRQMGATDVLIYKGEHIDSIE